MPIRLFRIFFQYIHKSHSETNGAFTLNFESVRFSKGEDNLVPNHMDSDP